MTDKISNFIVCCLDLIIKFCWETNSYKNKIQNIYFLDITLRSFSIDDEIKIIQCPVETLGSSRLITAVNQRWAWLVLGWVTAWEHHVLLAFFFNVRNFLVTSECCIVRYIKFSF